MRWLLVGLLLVAGLAVFVWGRFGRSVEAPLLPTTLTQQRHGFSLTFPPSWYGVQSLDVSAGQYNYVAFTHPQRLGEAGRDGKLEFSVFVLDQPDEEAPEGAAFLGERNGTRYAWRMTEAALPPGLERAAADITGILSTFVTSAR